MTPLWLGAYLSEAAQRELRAWEKNGEDMVASGRIERAELDANLAAWHAMAGLFVDGGADTSLDFAALEQVAAAALARRNAAVAANQDPDRHADLAARRDAVGAIHLRIARQRRLLRVDPRADSIEGVAA